jgi:hypothetical protein
MHLYYYLLALIEKYFCNNYGINKFFYGNNCILVIFAVLAHPVERLFPKQFYSKYQSTVGNTKQHETTQNKRLNKRFAC